MTALCTIAGVALRLPGWTSPLPEKSIRAESSSTMYTVGFAVIFARPAAEDPAR